MRARSSGMTRSARRSSAATARGHRTRPHPFDDVPGGGLVQRDADRVGVHDSDVDALPRACAAISAARSGTCTVIVSKNLRVTTSSPPLSRPSARIEVSRCTRVRCDADRPARGTSRRGRPSPEQNLRGADVAGRLLPPDVLLTRLQCEPSAGRPAASTDTPTSRPGIERLCASRLRRTPRAGRRSRAAPRNVATTRRRHRRPSPPAAATGPARGGRWRRRRARPARGAARSPGAVAHSAAAPRVLQQRPEHTGFGDACARLRRRPRPRSSARVRTTSIVCGWQSASTTNVSPAFGFSRRNIAYSQRRSPRRAGALAISMPVRSITMVWKLSSASRPSLRDLGLVRGVRRVPRGPPRRCGG